MTDLSYTPAFDPIDWVDNVSRISGDGLDGFNIRFDTIVSDLHGAAAAIDRIDIALGRPTGTPTGSQLFTPGLDFVLPAGAVGEWTYDKTGAVHPRFGDGASTAVMDLSLPADVRLDSFRAVGLYAGSPTALTIDLLRTPTDDVGATPDRLARVSSDASPLTNPYDVTMPVDSRYTLVDPVAYRYCVVLTATFVQDVTATSLATVQLAYTAA
ncbi:hypothetical protein [Streptomyces sp. NPDC008092]|uniref:hypothetical protein n=1 Tax=Streptomyces sp. NPDC008092 TaxID=3364808 RepID=UPI0036E413C7